MVGETIRQLRQKKGYTQAQLADKMKVSEKTISSWEVNRTEPSIGMIEILAEVLSCRKSDIIGEPTILSSDEYDLIKKYRLLDAFGVKAVVSTINNEYDRCIAMDREKESVILRA